MRRMHSRVEWNPRAFALACGAGLLAGSLFLGIGGRVAMRAIGALRGAPGELSIGGTLIVVFSGAWRGALGGLLYPVIQRLLPGAGLLKGLILGGATLILSIGLRPDGLQLARALEAVPLTLILFTILAILYGLSVQVTLERWASRTDSSREPSA